MSRFMNWAWRKHPKKVAFLLIVLILFFLCLVVFDLIIKDFVLLVLISFLITFFASALLLFFKYKRQLFASINEIQLFFSNLNKPKDAFLEELINVLQGYSPDNIIRDERELAFSVRSYLRGKTGWHIDLEKWIARGQKIDLIVNHSYAVEFKIAKSNEVLRNLLGQVEEYLKEYPKLIVFVLDVGQNVDLNYYLNSIKSKGAKVVKVKGKWSGWNEFN